MIVQANGEAYNIPINFDTYQLLNELAAVAREGAPALSAPMPTTVGEPVFEPPAMNIEGGNPKVEIPPGKANPLEQLAKVGLFEPQNVLDVINVPKPDSAVDDLMGVFEDTSEEDEEDDPGELNDGVEQYTGP